MDDSAKNNDQNSAPQPVKPTDSTPVFRPTEDLVIKGLADEKKYNTTAKEGDNKGGKSQD